MVGKWQCDSGSHIWGWLFALGRLLFKGKHARQEAVLSIPALFAVIIGPSRVYLGDHWASDVLGGYLLGGAWLCLFLRLYLALRKKGVLASE